MKNPDCECCLGNEYYCMCCDPHGDQPHMPHGYKHPAGYVWDAENHRQCTPEEWYAGQRLLRALKDGDESEEET